MFLSSEQFDEDMRVWFKGCLLGNEHFCGFVQCYIYSNDIGFESSNWIKEASWVSLP
jgi:hypothetical protein